MRKILSLFIITGLLHSCSPIGDKIDSKVSTAYYYQYHTNQLFYCPYGDWTGDAHEVDADVKTFKPLAENIAKDKDHVYCRYTRQDQIDVLSFVIEKQVIKDKRHVYYESYRDDSLKIIEGADPASFEYISVGQDDQTKWAKDKNSYFLDHRKLAIDYKTFEILNTKLCADKDYIYSPVSDTLVIYDTVKGKIEVLSPNYLLMNNRYICYYGYLDSKEESDYNKIDFVAINKLKVLDASTVVVNNKVIYDGELFPYKLVDAATYSIIDSSSFAKDRNHVYSNGKLMDSADVHTFELVRDGNSYYNGFAKDKYHVYDYKTVVDSADPKTFHYDIKREVWTDGKKDFYANDDD